MSYKIIEIRALKMADLYKVSSRSNFQYREQYMILNKVCLLS